MWLSQEGVPETSLGEFPYSANSPLTGKRTAYTEDVLEQEFAGLAEEAEGSKWTVGQSLYYQLPLISDMNRWLDEDCQEAIMEFMMIRDYNVPAATSLDDMLWNRMQNLLTIKEELSAWQRKSS